MVDRIDISRGEAESIDGSLERRIRRLERRCEWIEEHRRKSHRQVMVNQIAITFWLLMLMLFMFLMV